MKGDNMNYLTLDIGGSSIKYADKIEWFEQIIES